MDKITQITTALDALADAEPVFTSGQMESLRRIETRDDFHAALKADPSLGPAFQRALDENEAFRAGLGDAAAQLAEIAGSASDADSGIHAAAGRRWREAAPAHEVIPDLAFLSAETRVTTTHVKEIIDEMPRTDR